MRGRDPIGLAARTDGDKRSIGAFMIGLDNPLHIALLLAVLLLIFGAKRLPEMGRSLGHGLRGFKESISGEAPDPKGALSPVSAELSATSATSAATETASNERAAMNTEGAESSAATEDALSARAA
jgi:sec-independent protein translocase protein TatA